MTKVETSNEDDQKPPITKVETKNEDEKKSLGIKVETKNEDDQKPIIKVETKNEDGQQSIIKEETNKKENDQKSVAPKSPKSPKKKNKGLNRQNSISGPSIKRQGSSFEKLFKETKGSFEVIEEEYENDKHPIAPKSPKKALFSSYCKSSVQSKIN